MKTSDIWGTWGWPCNAEINNDYKWMKYDCVEIHNHSATETFMKVILITLSK